MRTILGIILASAACGPSVEQLRDRELCYERAEGAAQARVDGECSGSFATCPAADGILDELRLAQEACP
jgi:hypothetical protein